MLSVPAAVQVFLCLEPTGMRKGFDSLSAVVSEALEHDPLSGHLFVFRSKRGDRLKVLYWNRHGYALWYTRLEEGVFRFLARPQDARSLSVSAAELTMLPLYVGTLTRRGQRLAAASELLACFLSSQARQRFRECGFLPVKPRQGRTSRSVNREGPRLTVGSGSLDL